MTDTTTKSVLSKKQLRRVEAIGVARKALSEQKGLFSNENVRPLDELVDLSEYILEGVQAVVEFTPAPEQSYHPDNCPCGMGNV